MLLLMARRIACPFPNVPPAADDGWNSSVTESRIRHNRQIKMTLFRMFRQSGTTHLLPVRGADQGGEIRRNNAAMWNGDHLNIFLNIVNKFQASRQHLLSCMGDFPILRQIP